MTMTIEHAPLDRETFDYASLEPETATIVRAASERIRLRVRRVGEDVFEIGRDLLAVKGRVGHGNFGAWIEAEFAMSPVTARKFMNVADRFKDKTTLGVDFNPAVLYRLAAPRTSDEIVGKAIAKTKAGERVTAKDIEDWRAEAEAAEHDKDLDDRLEALAVEIEQIEKASAEQVQVLEKELAALKANQASAAT